MADTYHGRPCRRGHTLRYRANSVCVECGKQDAEQWAKANPDRRREIQRGVRARYAIKSPGKLSAKYARRRARIHNQRCECCPPALFEFIYFAAHEFGLEVDHRVPLALGGKHCGWNLEALTREQHREKTRADMARIRESRVSA